MADSNIDIRVRLQGARQAAKDAKDIAEEFDRLGREAGQAGRQSRTAAAGMGAAAGGTRKLKSGMTQTAAATKSAGTGMATTAAAGAGMSKMMKGAMLRAGGAAAGVFGLVTAVRTVGSEYTEAARAGAETTALIKATGGAANVSRPHLEGLATSISEQVGIDDEVIQKGQNMLLTFKNIRNETGKGNKVFDQASQSLVDMSVKMGKDPEKSAIQLGKALNDPVKGISALNRIGIQFTDTEKTRIKTLVDSGRRMEAQKMILREINNEMGGVAKAQAQPIDRLRVTFLNLAETIGKALAPAVNAGLTAIVDFITGMRTGAGAGGWFIRAIKNVAQWVKTAGVNIFTFIRPTFPLFARWGRIVFGIGRVFFKVSMTIGRILRVAISIIWMFGRAIQRIGYAVIRPFARVAIAAFKGLLPIWKILVGAAGRFVGTLRQRFQPIIGFLRTLWAPLWETFKKSIDRIKSTWDAIATSGPGKALGFKPFAEGGGGPVKPAQRKSLRGQAAGGITRSAGLSLIGERGPELLSLPRAARVDPLPRIGGPLEPVVGNGIINVQSDLYLDGRSAARAVGRVALAEASRR